MEEIFYLDSNVFIYAAIDTGRMGIKSRNILDSVKSNSKIFYTSALTFDEVFWKVLTKSNRKYALEIGSLMLLLPGLRFIPVDTQILSLTYQYLQESSLSPRDAIHVACSSSKKIKNIVSEDKDFDKVEGIKRRSINDF